MGVGTVQAFPFTKGQLQFCIQSFGSVIFLRIQVKMQDRIPFPFLLQTFHCQTFEQFLLPLEVCLQRADQQALSESPRTAEEIVPAGPCQLENFCCLVYIKVPVSAETLEILYTYRI